MPQPLIGGKDVKGNVRLSAPAPDGGLKVSLSSSNPAALSVNPNLMIPRGGHDRNFEMRSFGVDSDTSVTITARDAGGDSVSTDVVVHAAVLDHLRLEKDAVAGGQSVEGGVFLNGRAGPSGASVALSSSDSAASVPASANPKANQRCAEFKVNTNPVTANNLVTLTGTLNGVSKTVNLTVKAPAASGNLKVFRLEKSSTTGGAAVGGGVELDAPAADGGATVALSSDNPAADTPDSVNVERGHKTGYFRVATTPVTSETVANLTASLGSVTLSATLTLEPNVLVQFKLGEGKMAGGGRAKGAVLLGSKAPDGGALVSLSSSDPAHGSVPDSVTVPAGSCEGDFSAQTTAVTSETPVTFTASFGGVSLTQTLLLEPLQLAGVMAHETRVHSHQAAHFVVYLNGPAPASCLTVNLSSSDPALSLPPSVTVQSGMSYVTFTGSAGTVSAETHVVVTATANGVSKTTSLNVVP